MAPINILLLIIILILIIVNIIIISFHQKIIYNGGGRDLIKLIEEAYKNKYPKNKIQQILNDINIKDTDGNTALIVACINKLPDETIKFILDCGADPNLQNNNNSTALMAACISKQNQHISTLLTKGADPNLQNNGGNTALILACSVKDNDLENIIALLDNGADPNLKTINDNTALIVACHTKLSHDIIYNLLKRGADPNVINKKGKNALISACLKYEKPSKSVDILLNTLDSDTINFAITYFTENIDLDSNNYLDYLKCKLECYTEWKYATEGTKYLVDRILLDTETLSQLRIINDKLYKICDWGGAVHSAIKKLLDLGANPNSRYINHNENNTILIAACYKGLSNDEIGLLLDNGAEINAKNEYGDTALIVACRINLPHTIRIVKLLLDNGADPNLQDNNNTTALINACNIQSEDVINLLLDTELLTSNTVRNAIQYINENGNVNYAKYLESNYNWRNRKGIAQFRAALDNANNNLSGPVTKSPKGNQVLTNRRFARNFTSFVGGNI